MTPKVSVAMIAYNHERFVAQAIESVLAQRNAFDVEIVLGEDCSTDGTRAIVREFAARFPDRIRLLLPEKNLGANRNFAAVLAACRGEYVAMLECDDYWPDADKLQSQVERLDGDRNLTVCFTRAEVVDESGAPIATESVIREVRPTYTQRDYLARVFQPRTCTVLFRRGLFAELPDWYFRLPVGDFPIHVFNTEHGDFGFIDRITAAYRIHPGGMWSMGMNPAQWQAETREQRERMALRLKQVIDLYETMQTYLGNRHRATMRAQIANFARDLTHVNRTLEDWPEMRRSVRLQLRSLPLPEGTSALTLLRALLVSHLPVLALPPGKQTY